MSKPTADGNSRCLCLATTVGVFIHRQCAWIPDSEAAKKYTLSFLVQAEVDNVSSFVLCWPCTFMVGLTVEGLKESPGQMNTPRSWLFGGWKVSWWVWPEKYDPSQRGSAPHGISDAENIVFNTCLLSGKTNQFIGIQENKVRGNREKSNIFSQLLHGFILCSSIIMSTFSARILYWVTIWHWINPKNKKTGTAYTIHLFQQTLIYLP